MTKHINFSDREQQAAQLQAFYSWLPAPLHELPGIDWSSLQGRVLGFCVHAIGNNPEAGAVALAAGAAAGNMRPATLWGYVTKVHALLGQMRQRGVIRDLADLASRGSWETFAQETLPTHSRLAYLQAYSSLAGHQRAYLERLDPTLSASLQAYALPSLPLGFLKAHGEKQALVVQAHRRVRAKGELLASLYYPLLALIDLRAEAARQLLQAFRRACADETATLPCELLLRVTLPQLAGDARLLAREVMLRFLLWNRRAFVLAHPERLSAHALYNAQRGLRTYASERDHLFLAFEGDGRDLFWFGDLLEHDLLQHVGSGASATIDSHVRKALARELGAGNGFSCTRPGLLNAVRGWGIWLAALPRAANEYLFEPASLCRGILYAAALARLALTSGMSTSEMLQVSLDRRVPAEALGLSVDEGGAEVHLQYLLPKSARTEERAYMLVSPTTARLLDEICQEISAAAGGVKRVYPPDRGTKAELQGLERYIFQWASSENGRQGLLLEQDVVTLVRFLFHGIDALAPGGAAIRIDSHALRSAFAALLQEFPLDVASFALHLRTEQNARLSPTLSDVFPPQSEAALHRQIARVHRFHLEADARSQELVQAALAAAHNERRE